MTAPPLSEDLTPRQVADLLRSWEREALTKARRLRQIAETLEQFGLVWPDPTFKEQLLEQLRCVGGAR